MALATLKTRVQPSKASRVPVVPPGSWRAEKISSSARGYGYKWQQARAGWLRKHPLCVFCEKDGRTTAASVVDHIEPHRGDMVLFWDSSNWQSLCATCHNTTKAKMEANAVW